MTRSCLSHLTRGQAGDVTNRTLMSISDSTVVIAMKNFGIFVFFTESPIVADVPTRFFHGIWVCTPFPHLGSMLCRCPYKVRIIRQTTITRTPSHRSGDDGRLALPLRLWQPRYPEGVEATVIDGSLTFPHSYWVSQLDAVLRHTQDQITRTQFLSLVATHIITEPTPSVK